VYPNDAGNGEDLAKAADAAMYRAKERGRNTYRFYKSELTTKAFEHFSLEHGLRKALDRDEFELYYQPQVALDSGKIVGTEALIRWRHPETGLETPAKFITVAEDTGLIIMIGEWVLHTACTQAKLWQSAGLPAVKIAVNLSGRQILRDYTLLEKVRSALENSKLDPRCLVLEVTENVLQTSEKSINMLANLKSLGVRLAIDDFGIGYSSLTSIKRLPIDVVKVDRSFVQDIPGDPNDMAIAAAIIAMGHNLNLKVIAEGAETNEQLAFLKTQGCDEMQGFIFSEPLTSDGMYNILKQDKQLTEVAHIS
jgi:EAL domain-containing protein (putative c-di-GMP-specific phosphodiesterase class I)